MGVPVVEYREYSASYKIIIATTKMTVDQEMNK
jgi:hypothetical protein